MAIDPLLKDLFSHNVTIAKRTGLDKFSKPTFGAATTYPAAIERSQDTVRTDQGHETVSKRKVFLYSSVGWTSSTVPSSEDQLTLPGTHAPTHPQILMVQNVSDERGLHHIVLWC